MPLYDVLKRIEFKKTGEIKLPGDVIELDERRANWLMQQYQALRPRAAGSAETPALVKPRPPSISKRCCGR